MKRFTGKVAIVTGGGSGIGAAIAKRLAEEGASVMLAGRTAAKLEAVAGEIGGAGGVARWRAADVSSEDDIDALVAQTVADFGRLDVLVNNAGGGVFGRIAKLSTAQWRTGIGANLDSVFYACRAAMPHLKAAGGNVVNIASISGLGGDHGMSVYNAAKAAVINVSRALAVECAQDGVRVNAVSPGLIETPPLQPVLAFARREWEACIPLHRPGRVEDVAACVAFLASDEAAYVTGHNLVVDGGATAQTGLPDMLKLTGA